MENVSTIVYNVGYQANEFNPNDALQQINVFHIQQQHSV